MFHLLLWRPKNILEALPGYCLFFPWSAPKLSGNYLFSGSAPFTQPDHMYPFTTHIPAIIFIVATKNLLQTFGKLAENSGKPFENM